MRTDSMHWRSWGKAGWGAAGLTFVLLLSACSPRATPTTVSYPETKQPEPSATQAPGTSTATPFVDSSDTPQPSPTMQPSSTDRPTLAPLPTATVPATDTLAPTQTFTPAPQVLSAEEAQAVKPQDVLGEIWAMGGAGGDYSCSEIDLPPPHAELMRSPGVWAYELLMPAEILTCGWQAGERVSIRVSYPDGRWADYEDVAISWPEMTFGGFDFRFMPTLDDPAGDYRFDFYGASGGTSMTINFARPEGAQVNWLGDGRLLLYQFAPHEVVRLFVFDPHFFKSWQEVQVDERGSLEMTTTYQDESLVAVGEQSGESRPVLLFLDYANHSSVYQRWPAECSVILHPCPSGLEQRVTCNTSPSVCGDVPSLAVFSKPNLSGDQIGSLPSGESVFITGGPVCNNHMSWWKIELQGDQGWTPGWVSEGSRTEGYFLCP